MTPTKKLIPLSFSVKDFLAHFAPNTYGLSYSFPSFPVIGKQFVTFQLLYQELNASDVVIKLEQSLDNTNFDDLVDAAGNPVYMTLKNTQTSVTICLTNVNTAYIRCSINLHYTQQGYFTNYIYLTS